MIEKDNQRINKSRPAPKEPPLLLSFPARNEAADKKGEKRQNHDDIRQGRFCNIGESQDKREEQAEYGSHDEDRHDTV